MSLDCCFSFLLFLLLPVNRNGHQGFGARAEALVRTKQASRIVSQRNQPVCLASQRRHPSSLASVPSHTKVTYIHILFGVQHIKSRCYYILYTYMFIYPWQTPFIYTWMFVDGFCNRFHWIAVLVVIVSVVANVQEWASGLWRKRGRPRANNASVSYRLATKSTSLSRLASKAPVTSRTRPVSHTSHDKTIYIYIYILLFGVHHIKSKCYHM